MRPRALLAIGADTRRDDPAGPRRDFTVLAHVLQASVVDRQDVDRSVSARLIRRVLGLGPALAWIAFARSRRFDIVVTDGEHSGIPLALLLRLSRSRVRHVTIGHRLSSAKKRVFFTLLHLDSRMDRILLHAREQERHAREELGIAPTRLAVVPYQVDSQYWCPDATVTEEVLIASAGLEHRDYGTLIDAARGINARFVIGAASHWSRHSFAAGPLPPNVEVGQFDYAALRDLYRRAAIVVVPLADVDNQAGVTAILEAMATGKAVIVTQSVGQTDVVEDRRRESRGRPRPTSLMRSLATARGLELLPNGFYVAPGDAAELRAAIQYLLDHPDERSRLGRAGRRLVEELCTVDAFGARISELIGEVFDDASREPAALRIERTDA